MTDQATHGASGGREAAHARTVDDVVQQLGVDPDRGLDDDEAARRLEEHGENRLRRTEQRRWWQVLRDQFRSVIVLLLLAAAALSLAFGEIPEAIAIAAALVVDALVGFVTELRARRSMASLRRLGETTARVRRAGETRQVPAAELVPGDVVLLGEGQVVPADLRLIEVENLQIDESALTGESVPVAKDTGATDEDAPLAERSSSAYKGTAVTRGRGVAVTVGTGMATEVGHISELVEGAEQETTPLERRLDALGKRLIWLVFALAGVVATAGILTGRDLLLVVETAIVLGVAAVPEGLPIVSSLALARGVRRMADRNALVKRLSSVETLGSANVILTDKTGTLTEGRMQVAQLVGDGAEARGLAEDANGSWLDDGLLRRLLETAVLCTDADLEAGTGDPMELALQRLGRAAGTERAQLVGSRPQIGHHPFDRDTTMMATIHEDDGGRYIAVKGAPEAVLAAATRQASADGDAEGAGELDDAGRQRWSERNDQLAADGLRVLAVAYRRSDGDAADGDAADGDAADGDAADGAEPYHDLTLLGLVGLLDPPRQAAIEALDDARRAGIRVVMVTGDQPPTAQAIARAVGIVTDDDATVVVGSELRDPRDLSEDEEAALRKVVVFARVSPEDKLDLIALHQDGGAIVGMTGDGVNDAPALQKADIGIAMGRRGTEVAQDAADIVLLDDAFDTIVGAVRYGRTVFANIRKFVIFLLSGNLAEILAVTAATLVGLPLPLLPLQILYINFVSDVFPALALGLGEASGDVMAQPPRDADEPIVARRHWIEIGLWGALIAATVMGGLLYALFVLDMPRGEVATVSFLAFGFARTWHTFNMRGQGSGWLRNEVTTNPFVWVAVVIGMGLMLLAALFGPLAGLLQVAAPTGSQWTVILVASLVPLVIGQLVRSWPRSPSAASDRSDAASGVTPRATRSRSR